MEMFAVKSGQTVWLFYEEEKKEGKAEETKHMKSDVDITDRFFYYSIIWVSNDRSEECKLELIRFRFMLLEKG